MKKHNKKTLSALQATRKIFQRNDISDTESSDESDESQENSHVPLKNYIPSVEGILLDENEGMEALNQQLALIMEQLQTLNANQQHQQQAIENLQNAPPAADAAPTLNQNARGINLDHLYKIPDPIKSLPIFDGNRKQLSAWLTTAENTLLLFKNHVDDILYNMYVTAVANKIQGKAKDIICLAGNPQTFDEIKDILTTALGDRQELSTYKSQLWQHHMTDGMTIHRYYTKTKEIMQNIKTLAKQKDNYRKHWEGINEFIEEDVLAAFIAGLSHPYFGHAQAARPKDLEDAYAFLCKFKAKEITANIISESNKTQKPFRTNNHKQFNSDFQGKDKYEGKKSLNPYSQEKNEDKKFSNTHSQPMDVDNSVRSRLTLNKRQINNNEASQSDDSEEEIDLNFQQESNPEDPI